MMRGYPEVNLRLAIEPMEALIEKGMVPIYATKEDMQAEFEMGLRTGAKAVENLLASGGVSNHSLIMQ